MDNPKKFFTTIKENQKFLTGFTIIELLIYSAITCFVLVIFSLFVWQFIEGDVRKEAITEVEQNANFVMEKITRAIKQSSAVIKPGKLGEVSTLLQLKKQQPKGVQTKIEASQGRVIITEGGESYQLTTDRVQVTDIRFTNLSYDNTPGTMKVEMTIRHLNPGGKKEFEASLSLDSSVSLLVE